MAKKEQNRIQAFISQYKKRSWLYKIGTAFCSLAALGILAVALLVLSIQMGLFGKLPTHSQLMAVKNPESTLIYSSDEVVIGKFFTKNRTNIDLSLIHI